MKFITCLIFTLSCIFSTSLFAVKEKDIFPDHEDDYHYTITWYDADHNLYILLDGSIITVNTWHYANIED